MGKDRFIICMENNTVMNNNTKISCFSYSQSESPLYHPVCVYNYAHSQASVLLGAALSISILWVGLVLI